VKLPPEVTMSPSVFAAPALALVLTLGAPRVAAAAQDTGGDDTAGDDTGGGGGGGKDGGACGGGPVTGLLLLGLSGGLLARRRGRPAR
jgi:hypothetical protein